VFFVEYGLGFDFTENSQSYWFYLIKKTAANLNFYCDETMPIAHSIATLGALAPYRRALVLICSRNKKSASLILVSTIS
jgi:hypothetical protein